MKKLLISVFCSSALALFAQKEDTLFIRSLFDEALSNGRAHEDLRSLCKDIGARLSGSPEAQMAIEWGKTRLESYGFDKVYLQPIKVPHWERGTKESAWLRGTKGSLHKINVMALGGSIPTEGMIEAELIEFSTLEALKKGSKSDVEGKMVFINQPMDEKQITTFRAYGGCWSVRVLGAIEAAKLGAKALIIRSLGMPEDDYPHTGSMAYADSVPKIPAAAVSTSDANFISNYLKSNKKARLAMELNCQSYPDKDSYNVIAEITGTVFPNSIITFGGHLDSWDAGEGAHDDGAGVVHCMEALRLLKINGYNPTHTLRLVFFMNEENGNNGGKTYATWTKEREENQIAAVESDRGGFAPRGFHCEGSDKHIALIKSFKELLLPYGLYDLDKGGSGADIAPLKESFPGIPLFGFIPDSQRYFDFHHCDADVFESVNKRELELGAASIAAFIYLLDKHL
jgi:carboxypeptidase Q